MWVGHVFLFSIVFPKSLSAGSFRKNIYSDGSPHGLIYLCYAYVMFMIRSLLFLFFTGRLNKCGVISPRFDVAINEIEKWTNNLLPSRQFGYVVLTTSGGIMDHEEARRKHLGGKILGFFF